MISCDYLFVTSRGTFLRKDYTPLEGEEALKVLVVYCNSTKCIFAHAVPQKGVDDDGYCVEQMVNDIAWLGHSRVVIRSDNEPAIAKLVLESLKALKVEGIEQAAAEGSVPYDPQSNGAAESAVRVFKGMLRTLQLSLERELKARIPVGHPVMTWLVRHAAHNRTLRLRGEDGQTGYQRARGAPCNTRTVSFGEMCRFKTRAQEAAGSAWRWTTGIWLGRDHKTGQYIYWDHKKICHARTLIRVPDEQKWVSEEVAKITSTPW